MLHADRPVRQELAVRRAENRAPTAAGSGSGSPDAAPLPGGRFFILLEAKAVGYDFSLDGNLFDSHSVSRRPFVGQSAMGFALHGSLFGRRTQLAIMRVFKTREFSGQESHHAYGSLALSVDL